MNLQTIQKRIEELQAELLTVSNDLAFLIAGEVIRTSVPVPVFTPCRVLNFKSVKAGDILRFSEPFRGIAGDLHEANDYEVARVEVRGYQGMFSVAIKTGVHTQIDWINFDRIAQAQIVQKVGA